ncbi:MAG: phage terminase large subunit family protein [Alphaproteobacteria bacterium]
MGAIDNLLACASTVVLTAALQATLPAPRITISQWAKDHRRMPETGPRPGAWDADLFPFLDEIMDCLSPWHPAEEVAFVKAAQIGGSECGLNMLLAIIDLYGGSAMMVQPTIKAAQEYAKEKLNPSIKTTESVQAKVAPQKRADGEGSTALYKVFPGGFLILTGSNSAADLASKTIRWAFGDELDRWEQDLDGQGHPLDMLRARQIAFMESGDAKRFLPCTPTNWPGSLIWQLFLDGDQRRFFVPCPDPDCGEMQVLEFFEPGAGDGKSKTLRLRFNDSYPYEACLPCQCCGQLIRHSDLPEILKRGEWRAQNPGPGREPSFQISALYSQFISWDKIAERWLQCDGDRRREKAFYNLILGVPYETAGEAPDWERLLTRREEFEPGVVPHGALVVTAAIDVQRDGLFWEIHAHGPGNRTWCIDFGYIEGETSVPLEGAWIGAQKLYHRPVPTVWGTTLQIDAMAVDAGYNSNAVYVFCRSLPRAVAIKGAPGWFTPPIGTPSKVEVATRSGRKLKRGADLRQVGTWSLKDEFYARLRIKGPREGAEHVPKGFIAHGPNHDEGYFKQITAEKLVTKTRRGVEVREWEASGPNHYHDTSVYNMAMTHYLGLPRFTDEEWQELARQRSVPQDQIQRDLFGGAMDGNQNSHSDETATTFSRYAVVLSSGIR